MTPYMLWEMNTRNLADKIKSSRFDLHSIFPRCFCGPSSAAGDEEPVAVQVVGEEQTPEEALA